MTSYLSQKVLPVMMAASFLNYISWMGGQMGGWMDGWMGGEFAKSLSPEWEQSWSALNVSY